MHKDKSGRRVLTGNGSYDFEVIVDGDDLLVENVRATWFGGQDDPGDSGETASGVMNNQSGPETPLGCALPLPGTPDTEGTPFPKLPWMTNVSVSSARTGRTVTVPLIDTGPAKPPKSHAALDLTQSAFAAIGGDKEIGHITVTYRVIGGAAFVSECADNDVKPG